MIPRIGTLELAQNTYAYTGKPIKPKVIVQTTYGDSLTEGEDYNVTYWKNVKVGQATVRVAFKDFYESTYDLNFEIVGPEFKNSMLRLNKKSISYSKKTVRPKVVVDGGYDINDFTVKYVKPTNKNVGTHSVIVTNDRYGVNKKLTYVIKPIGTKLKKLTPARKAITVKWNKQSTKMAKSRITGYQIQYSRSSKFKSGNKTVTVKGYSKTSKKLKSLKAKKKYYVHVRTYKTVNGKKYYSSWSKSKSVKTK